MLDDYDKKRRDLLTAVYNLTQGDCQKTAKMLDIGRHLGLDRNDTEAVALDLVGDGFLEIKSLSGALSLTGAGLEETGGGSLSAPESTGMDEFIERLEQNLPTWDLNPDARKNLEIDLATLKLQQQRSTALPGVQKTVLTEIAEVLKVFDGIGNILEVISLVTDVLDA